MTKTPAPKIYSSTIAPDNNIWVMGSVDGVKIAPIMVAASTVVGVSRTPARHFCCSDASEQYLHPLRLPNPGRSLRTAHTPA